MLTFLKVPTSRSAQCLEQDFLCLTGSNPFCEQSTLILLQTVKWNARDLDTEQADAAAHRTTFTEIR